MTGSTAEATPGRLPFRWPTWLTAVVVAAILTTRWLTAGQPPAIAIPIHLTALAIGGLAAAEIYAELRGHD